MSLWQRAVINCARSPSPDSPRGVPSTQPSFASIAKPLFVLLILVSTVMTSRSGLRTCSSYLSISMGSFAGGGDGDREINDMSSSLSPSWF